MRDAWSLESEPLGRLRKLSNDDKHRAIHALALYGGLLWIGAPEGGGVTLLHGDPPPWSPGSVVVRWQLAGGSNVDRYSPNGDVLIGLDPEDAAAERSVVAVMQWLEYGVRMAVGRLEREVLQLFPLTRRRRSSTWPSGTGPRDMPTTTSVVGS